VNDCTAPVQKAGKRAAGRPARAGRFSANRLSRKTFFQVGKILDYL